MAREGRRRQKRLGKQGKVEGWGGSEECRGGGGDRASLGKPEVALTNTGLLPSARCHPSLCPLPHTSTYSSPHFTSFLFSFSHSPIYLWSRLVEYLLYNAKDPAPNLQPPQAVTRIRQRQKLL